jgi:hypothetical protein
MKRTKRTTTDEKGRALLLATGGRSGFALTPDGRFIRVRRRPEDEVGREVEIPARAVGTRSIGFRRSGFRLRPGLATAFVLALCLLALSPLAVGKVLASGSPVAFVTVDASPSLEFGVNRWNRVVDAQGLNAQGESLLIDLAWRGRRLVDVVDDVGEAAVAGGYVAGGQAGILVAVVPAATGAGVPPGVENALSRIRERLSLMMEAEGRGGEVTVETVLADAVAIRDQAERLGLSVGRYVVLLAAQEAGLDVDADDLRGGVGEAIASAGGQPGDVLHAAHLNRQMTKLAEKFQERNGLAPKGAGEAGQGESGAGNGADTEAPDEQGLPDHGSNGNGGQPGSGGQRGPDRDHGQPPGSGQGSGASDEWDGVKDKDRRSGDDPRHDSGDGQDEAEGNDGAGHVIDQDENPDDESEEGSGGGV